jgi:hypothetical protein
VSRYELRGHLSSCPIQSYSPKVRPESVVSAGIVDHSVGGLSQPKLLGGVHRLANKNANATALEFRHSVRAMVRAMKACQRVLLVVNVEGGDVGWVGHRGPWLGVCPAS